MISQYDFLRYQGSLHEILYFLFLRGYAWEGILSMLVIIALFIRRPIGYVLFMIYPFYFWTTAFVAHFDLSDWLKIGIWGFIIPFLFNLNFIRNLYITDSSLLTRKLFLAAGIGIVIGLSPFVRYIFI